MMDCTDGWILVVAMICITLLALANVIINGQDGLILSTAGGMIVFIATKKDYLLDKIKGTL